MWLGIDSRTRCHMWVEFVVGSLLCCERFFPGYSSFPLFSKTNISKFQFDPDFSGQIATLWRCHLNSHLTFFLFLIIIIIIIIIIITIIIIILLIIINLKYLFAANVKVNHKIKLKHYFSFLVSMLVPQMINKELHFSNLCLMMR